MKLNVGDYVRTKDGYIAKIVDIEKRENYDYVTYYFDKKVSQYGWDDGNIYDITTLDINDTSFKKNKDMIMKSSPNIIDLIEVGDYVNGCMVINKNDDTIQIIQMIIPFDLKENDIKNIVTHEQFESMQYVVKED